MRYIGSGKIRLDAPAARVRVRALLETLEALGCDVLFDQHHYVLEFKVPEDLYFWIRAGGLDTIRSEFEDITESLRCNHEEGDTEPGNFGAERQLPVPDTHSKIRRT